MSYLGMYTLENYESITKKGFSYTLPGPILQCIHDLTHSIKDKPHSLNPMKSEKIVSPIQECTDLLNKLTQENFTIISSQLSSLIFKLQNDNIEELVEILFSIVSTNTFYSEVYASLYTILCNQWPSFIELLLNKINIHIESFTMISSYDSSDYDNFCKTKLQIDQRKAFTLFLYHLTKKNILVDQYKRIIQELYRYIEEYILLESKKETVMELIEHIYILKPSDISNVKKICDMNIQNYPGLSNQAIFRCMDILEELN